MDKLDISQVMLHSLVTHHIGNKHRDEKLILSDSYSEILNDDTKEYLLDYFLLPFKPIDFHVFTHTVELGMNEVYTLVKRLFLDKNEIVSISKDIAKLLFDNSNHPKIKEGELSVVYFDNIIHDGKNRDAIGILKSENSVPFIKMKEDNQNFSIEHDFGFELKGIDKGCLIFNTNEDKGFDILTVNNNKNEESFFWTESFLNITARSDEFHKTKRILEITKDFITKKLPEQFDIDKAESIDMLNRTISYFKKNESFDKDDFESTIFFDENVINSFNDFESSVNEDDGFGLEGGFDISKSAVKKQTRAFKSVLKLDRNFHVYIHGDKDLIEKGVDDEGRKFYKIYYVNEE